MTARYDLADSRRGHRNQLFFSSRNCDQCRVSFHFHEFLTHEPQCATPRRKGERSNGEEPEIQTQAAIVYIEQSQPAFPRSDQLVVSNIRIIVICQYVAFIGKDDRRKIRYTRSDAQ